MHALLEAPGAGILPPTSGQGYGAAGGALACRTRSKKSWIYTFACSSRRTFDHRKDWRCEASSSFRQLKEFLEPQAGGHCSSEPASKGSLAQQASMTQRLTGPGTPTVPVSRSAVARRRTLRTTASLSLLVHASDKGNGKRAESSSVVNNCRSRHMPSDTEAQAKTVLSTPDAWNKCRNGEDGRASTVCDATKNMLASPGLCPRSHQNFSGKGRHSNATWNDSGKGFNACAHWTHVNRRTSFLLYFQHSPSCWHNFERSRICSSLSGLPADRRLMLDNLVWLRQFFRWLAAGRVLGLWSGTPSLHSV